MLLSNNERVRYEFDKTGKSQDNLVSSERHKTKNLLHRIIVPIYGAFYNTSVVLKDVKSGKIIPKTSYRFDDPSVVVAQRTGFGASHTIILTDTTVGDEIDVTYQVVGGIYGADKMNSIYDRLVDANLDNRPVDWTNITNKPAEFVPTEHLHPVDQLYGFEHLVYVMERYVQATLIGDEASHDVIWDALEKLDERVTTNHTQITAALNAHKLDFNNPHAVTAAQVGTLTTAQINAAIKVVSDSLNSHIKDMNNPHATTAAQVGTLTTAQIQAADTSILNQAKAYTDALQNKILQANGLVKPTLIPLSATTGNELERNSDGLFFQVSTSAWAVQYGWVERLTDGNVQWRSQNNATKVSLYPSTWA